MLIPPTMNEMRILIINGPNLNLLGMRRPEIYGRETFGETLAKLRKRFGEVTLEYFQSNSEGRSSTGFNKPHSVRIMRTTERPTPQRGRKPSNGDRDKPRRIRPLLPRDSRCHRGVSASGGGGTLYPISSHARNSGLRPSQDAVPTP